MLLLAMLVIIITSFCTNHCIWYKWSFPHSVVLYYLRNNSSLSMANWKMIACINLLHLQSKFAITVQLSVSFPMGLKTKGLLVPCISARKVHLGTCVEFSRDGFLTSAPCSLLLRRLRALGVNSMHSCMLQMGKLLTVTQVRNGWFGWKEWLMTVCTVIKALC